MKLSDITGSSRWQLPIFEGKIIIEGRILSPAESETAGLASSLLAAQLAPPEKMAEFAKMHEEIDDENADLSDLLKWSKILNPETLLQIAKANEKIICSTIKRFSYDGETWENCRLVMSEAEQDAEKNQLWVGMIWETDRDAILEKALKGHEEAKTRIAGF